MGGSACAIIGGSVCTISGWECMYNKREGECLYYEWLGVSVLSLGGRVCTISGWECLYYKRVGGGCTLWS